MCVVNPQSNKLGTPHKKFVLATLVVRDFFY